MYLFIFILGLLHNITKILQKYSLRDNQSSNYLIILIILIVNISEYSVFRWRDWCRVIRREGWSTERDGLCIHKFIILQFNNSYSPTLSICARDWRLRQRDFAHSEAAVGMPTENQGPQGIQNRLMRTMRRPNGQVAWNSVSYVEQSRLRLADTSRWLVSLVLCYLCHITDDDYRRSIHRACHSD